MNKEISNKVFWDLNNKSEWHVPLRPGLETKIKGLGSDKWEKKKVPVLQIYVFLCKLQWNKELLWNASHHKGDH